MTLTRQQTDLLYHAAEWHHKWFKVYSDSPPSFADVLQLNHEKITHIGEMIDFDTIQITQFLIEMRDNYEQMYNDYK
jgi:hypothetical protein